MRPSVRRDIEEMSIGLGVPIATPARVMASDYKTSRRLVTPSYRVFRWECPVCFAGCDDPEGIYKPLSIDSDGNVQCKSGCSMELVRAAILKLIEEKVRNAQT